jgi:hypothetical protein
MITCWIQRSLPAAGPGGDQAPKMATSPSAMPCPAGDGSPRLGTSERRRQILISLSTLLVRSPKSQVTHAQLARGLATLVSYIWCSMEAVEAVTNSFADWLEGASWEPSPKHERFWCKVIRIAHMDFLLNTAPTNLLITICFPRQLTVSCFYESPFPMMT